MTLWHGKKAMLNNLYVIKTNSMLNVCSEIILQVGGHTVKAQPAYILAFAQTLHGGGKRKGKDQTLEIVRDRCRRRQN